MSGRTSTLLMPDLIGFRSITNAETCELLDDDTVDEVECFNLRISGNSVSTLLGVCKQDFTLRMYREHLPHSIQEAMDSFKKLGLSHFIPQLVEEVGTGSLDIDRSVKFESVSFNDEIDPEIFSANAVPPERAGLG